MTRAVVLGGGFAGLLAAVALREHVDEVIAIESDRYPDAPARRKGVPQSSHSHLLVEGCALAVEELLPGCIDALLSRGARRIALTEQALIQSQMGWFSRFQLGVFVISCGRGLLDHVLRQKAGVPVWQGVTAERLIGDRARVTGVLVRRQDSTNEVIAADVVVDATGRRSNALKWLTELGQEIVRQEVADSGLASSSRHYEIPPDLVDELPAIILQPQIGASDPGRGATVFPIENNRFILTLTGPKASPPPVGEAGFREYAQSLGHGIVAELMAASVPVEPVRAYRNLTSRRRYLEQAILPRGFLAIGDALVAVQPGNSHGMANAALGARRLQQDISRFGLDTDLQTGVAEAAETGWQMATEPYARQGSSTKGTGRALTPLEQRIAERIEAATPRSPELAKDFFRAHMLIPQGPTRGMSDRLQVAMKAAEAPLGADEAIKQYPALEKWWCQRASRPAAQVTDDSRRHPEPRLLAK